MEKRPGNRSRPLLHVIVEPHSICVPLVRHGQLENARIFENPTFVSPITGASGTGTFELDGEDLEFKMAIEAEGLMPDTWYYLSATVREVAAGDFSYRV